jgi:hypothetical protein
MLPSAFEAHNPLVAGSIPAGPTPDLKDLVFSSLVVNVGTDSPRMIPGILGVELRPGVASPPPLRAATRGEPGALLRVLRPSVGGMPAHVFSGFIRG